MKDSTFSDSDLKCTSLPICLNKICNIVPSISSSLDTDSELNLGVDLTETWNMNIILTLSWPSEGFFSPVSIISFIHLPTDSDQIHCFC